MDHELENVTVRDAEPADSLAIRQLAREAKIDAWSEADYSDEIVRPDSFVLKAPRQGTLCGFLVARIVPGTTAKPDADLYNIAVAPLNRREGIGTKLLVALLGRLSDRGVHSVWLEVRESNLEAISFYETQGFVAEVTRPNFYTNPIENAVIMRLRISPDRYVSEE